MGRRGFTLVEVVVTVGILLVLGVVTLPIASRVAAVKEDVGCLSNLRQIGLGIQVYALENNDTLPGPLYAGQYPYYSYSHQLSYHLADYLNLDTSIRKKRDDVFLCLAHKRAMKKVGRKVGDSAVYQLNTTVHMGGEPSRPPFGFRNDIYPQIYGTKENFSPMKKVRLTEITDADGNPAAASTWMLRDLDKKGITRIIDNAGFSVCPDERVHRTHRNALFFDFHVERTDIVGASE